MYFVAMLGLLLSLQYNSMADMLQYNGQRKSSLQGEISLVQAQAFASYRAAVFNLETQDPSCVGSWSFNTSSSPPTGTCPSDGNTYDAGLPPGSVISPFWYNYQGAGATYAWYYNPANSVGSTQLAFSPGTFGEFVMEATHGSVLVGYSQGTTITVVNTNAGGGVYSSLTVPISGATIPAGSIVSFQQAG